MSNKSPTALRTIGEVADDVGVATHVLRFWESKFFQIKPQKRRGRRYYRPEDIKTITQIKFLLYGQGYTIRGVQKFLAAESKGDVENIVANSDEVQLETVAPVTPLFNTDLFGNIVEAGEKENNSEEVAEEGVNKLDVEDVKKLKEVYSGLSNIRDVLKDVA